MIFLNQRKLGIRRYTSKVRMYTGWPAMIALMDIFFLLLWFFAMSSSYTRLSGIRVELPKAKASSIADIHQYVISIMPTGDAKEPFGLYFRNLRVKDSQLQEALTKLPSSPTPMVAILADRHTPYEEVARVLTMVGNAGFNCFLPVMDPKEPPERRFEK